MGLKGLSILELSALSVFLCVFVCSCSELVAVESSGSQAADVKVSTYPAELSDSMSLLDICESSSNWRCIEPSSAIVRLKSL